MKEAVESYLNSFEDFVKRLETIEKKALNDNMRLNEQLTAIDNKRNEYDVSFGEFVVNHPTNMEEEDFEIYRREQLSALAARRRDLESRQIDRAPEVLDLLKEKKDEANDIKNIIESKLNMDSRTYMKLVEQIQSTDNKELKAKLLIDLELIKKSVEFAYPEALENLEKYKKLIDKVEVYYNFHKEDDYSFHSLEDKPGKDVEEIRAENVILKNDIKYSDIHLNVAVKYNPQQGYKYGEELDDIGGNYTVAVKFGKMVFAKECDESFLRDNLSNFIDKCVRKIASVTNYTTTDIRSSEARITCFGEDKGYVPYNQISTNIHEAFGFTNSVKQSVEHEANVIVDYNELENKLTVNIGKFNTSFNLNMVESYEEIVDSLNEFINTCLNNVETIKIQASKTGLDDMILSSTKDSVVNDIVTLYNLKEFFNTKKKDDVEVIYDDDTVIPEESNEEEIDESKPELEADEEEIEEPTQEPESNDEEVDIIEAFYKDKENTLIIKYGENEVKVDLNKENSLDAVADMLNIIVSSVKTDNVKINYHIKYGLHTIYAIEEKNKVINQILSFYEIEKLINKNGDEEPTQEPESNEEEVDVIKTFYKNEENILIVKYGEDEVEIDLNKENSLDSVAEELNIIVSSLKTDNVQIDYHNKYGLYKSEKEQKNKVINNVLSFYEIEKLINKKSNDDLNYEALIAAKEEASAKVETDYSKESFGKLTNALAMPEESQSEIDTKVEAINEALVGLTVDKIALNEIKNLASTKKELDYSKESWKAVENALAMPEESQSEIDVKVKALEKAIAGLTHKKVDPIPPQSSEHYIVDAHLDQSTNELIIVAGTKGEDDYVEGRFSLAPDNISDDLATTVALIEDKCPNDKMNVHMSNGVREENIICNFDRLSEKIGLFYGLNQEVNDNSEDLNSSQIQISSQQRENAIRIQGLVKSEENCKNDRAKAAKRYAVAAAGLSLGTLAAITIPGVNVVLGISAGLSAIKSAIDGGLSLSHKEGIRRHFINNKMKSIAGKCDVEFVVDPETQTANFVEEKNGEKVIVTSESLIAPKIQKLLDKKFNNKKRNGKDSVHRNLLPVGVDTLVNAYDIVGGIKEEDEIIRNIMELKDDKPIEPLFSEEEQNNYQVENENISLEELLTNLKEENEVLFENPQAAVEAEVEQFAGNEEVDSVDDDILETEEEFDSAEDLMAELNKADEGNALSEEELNELFSLCGNSDVPEAKVK